MPRPGSESLIGSGISPGARFGAELHATVGSRPLFGAEVTRHLILGYRPGWQSPADLAAIAAHMREMDPTIGTFILPTVRPNGVSGRLAAGRPTLVVSAGPIRVFAPRRGKIYQGQIIPKVEELRRLEAAGVPVPRWALLTPGLRVDPAEWGEFVVVKPTDIATSSHGLGIQLMRANRVRYRAPEDYPEGHPGRVGPMLVQQFVDTGEHIAAHRVLTLFGEPLYAVTDLSDERRPPLTAGDDDLERIAIASQAIKAQQKVFVDDPAVLALARRAHAAIPDVPVKGVDILRDARTGALFVIELNCGGNTWHFSSRQQAQARIENGPEFERQRYRQFDAMRTAARVLVARTISEAA
jgi:hypothetical protein